MELNDYKDIISRIDKKIEKDNNKLKEEEINLLKKARRTIFIIISLPSRFFHKDSVFTDSICKDGKWVILDGIEMAPSQILEKIASLCGENPELSIFESGKDINITSKDIHKNFQIFIVYNPFNKGSKIIDPVIEFHLHLFFLDQGGNAIDKSDENGFKLEDIVKEKVIKLKSEGSNSNNPSETQGSNINVFEGNKK
jgi:hypothetical protein